MSPLTILPFVSAALFCFSAVAEDWLSARWTVATVMFYAMAQGVTLSRLARRGAAARGVAIALGFGLLSHNAYALRHELTLSEAHTYRGEELIPELQRRGITRAYGEYWHAYAITFATDERIVVEPVFNHYSPHFGP